MTQFQTRVLLAARRVASISAVGGKEGEHLAPLSPTFKRKMREIILETESAIFDGILLLRRGGTSTGPTDLETRLLYTLSTLQRLSETAIPAFMRRVAEQLGGDSAAVDSATLEEMIEDMDERMHAEYVEHRAEPLCDMMRSGVAGANWAGMPPPHEVRAYMHRVVLLLVEAHARVGDSAPALVDRVVETLIERVASAALEAFRRVHLFGTGGMLTATLEVEFLSQCVTGYLTPAAKKTLSDTYRVIEGNYRPLQGSKDELARDMDSMKAILEASRRGASVETLCFRRDDERRGSKTK